MDDKQKKELANDASNEVDDDTSKPDQKLTEFKQSLTKEGHLEEREGQMSYVAKDFMKMLNIRGSVIYCLGIEASS